jgi:hypothetical protein
MPLFGSGKKAEAMPLMPKSRHEKHMLYSEHGVSFDKAKRCFENSIFCRVACGEGSVFICFIILTLQLFSPFGIMMKNLTNLEICLTVGSDLAMPWDIQFQNLLFVTLVWQAIVNDTERSIAGLQYAIGLKRLPRNWCIWLGFLSTPVVNTMTGLAASFLLLDPEIKMVDAAINSFALLFINRLDEDFGKLEDVVYIASKGEEGLDHEESDEEVAERYLTAYGPWTDEWLEGGQRFIFIFVTVMCRFMWLASIVVPSTFFFCGF